MFAHSVETKKWEMVSIHIFFFVRFGNGVLKEAHILCTHNARDSRLRHQAFPEQAKRERTICRRATAHYCVYKGRVCVRKTHIFGSSSYFSLLSFFYLDLRSYFALFIARLALVRRLRFLHLLFIYLFIFCSVLMAFLQNRLAFSLHVFGVKSHVTSPIHRCGARASAKIWKSQTCIESHITLAIGMIN